MAASRPKAALFSSLVIPAYLTPQEKNGYIDERGFLTPDAKDRIAKALVGRLYDSPADFQSTPPELRNKLERIAPQVLRLEGRPGWGITPAIREAVGILGEVKARKTTVDKLINQPDLNGKLKAFSPEAVALARTLGNGPVAAQRAFRQYANDEVLSREGAQSAFFEPPTREQAFQEAFSNDSGLRAAKPRIPRVRPEGEVQVSYRPGRHGAPGVLYGSPAATELVAYLLGGNGFDGVNLPPDLARRVVNRARWELYNSAYPKPQRAELRRFAEEFERMLKTGKSVSYVEAPPGASVSFMKGTAREEVFHGQQVELGGGTDIGHIGDARKFMENPLAETAGNHLVAEWGYHDDPDNLAAEIGAKLAAGKWQELGLSEAEAMELAYRYARALVVQHGPGVVFKLRRISPILREAFHEAGRYGTEPPENWSDTGGAKNAARPLGGAPARPSPSRRIGARTDSTGRGGGEGQGGIQPRVERNLPRQVSISGEGQVRANRSPKEDRLSERQNSLFSPEETSQVARESARDRDKLQGERLTAQFKAPLTREEQLKKLKPAEKPPQTSLFEPTPEKAQGGLFDERGSTPMIGDLYQFLESKFGEDGPKANYSGLGALQDKFVHNLSQLEKANANAHAAAVRAASSRAQSAIILRGAAPAIEKALAGSGFSWQELRQGLIESRLRGIKQRWLDFADQARRADDIGLHKAFENGLSGLLEVIEGQRGLPQDLAQTAAALLQPGANPLLNTTGGPDYASLRELLVRTFTDAAKRVAPMMDSERFNELKADPHAREALRVYKNLVEKRIAENHALNEGVFSTALGPLDTYYPLIPLPGAR